MTQSHSANPIWTVTPRMEAMGDALIEELMDVFGQHGLQRDTLGLVVLRDTSQRPEAFLYRGDWHCYPCSVVKVFHLVHAVAQLEAGLLTPHAELDRALRDMIMWSSNMATNYVIDLMTGTTGDTLLAEAEMAEWRQKREGLNDFFRKLGWAEFDGANINQKLMDDLRYGREAIFAGPENENRNCLTPAVSARLMAEIFNGSLPVSDVGLKRVQDTLFRDRSGPLGADPLFQVVNYATGGLPADLPVWSKAGRLGWTGDPRICWHKHDLVRTLGRDGTPIIISLMTQGKQICEDRPETLREMGKLIWQRAEAL
ncbi:serine hydrolase [Pseudorhodobacter sp.]|uniref:serine hydrolase n=1 Tax=Pseudorhodobacter sp. TaxID=1934400 RepID=UPI00264A04AC|nr:serine hydrolase [Pseudorhodobacter sp.]MDN5786806.1 class A beta-lactamase-related serine hydrolase [Pseudorhodobacter sp.]